MGLISRVSSRTYRISQNGLQQIRRSRSRLLPPQHWSNRQHRRCCRLQTRSDRRTQRRQAKINLNRVQLTKFKVEGIFHGARSKVVNKAWESSNIDSQWQESPWAKKIAQKEARRNLNDFQRFQVMKLKQQRTRIINRAVNKA